MDDFTPTNPHETPPPPPRATPPDESAPVTMAEHDRRPWARRMLSNRRRGWIVAAALMVPVIGISAHLATSSSASAGQVAAPSAGAGAGGAGFGGGGGGGSPARSAPSAGGATGTVASVSKATFTLTTSAGQKVIVNEASSTKYQKGTSSTSASAVTKGAPVLVLGTVNGTTIAATQVIVQTTSGGSVSSSTTKVVPFKRGAPSTAKQVGQIPANFSEGSGTIVGGTAATKATEAALAAYPGGVVNRVVKLSDGEYNVHYLGVNWPHHIFVNQSFKVVGAL
jgi:hypothetical protein